MSRVFVPQQMQTVKRDEITGQVIQISPKFNLMPAEEYGEVTILLKNENGNKLSLDNIVQHLYDGLSDFDNEDYIIPIGKPAMIGITIAIAAMCNKGRFKLLQWDKNNRCYNASEFNFDGIKDFRFHTIKMRN